MTPSNQHVVPRAGRPLGLRSVVAMGFAGGLVPSPSAAVVLLGVFALGRAWFGVILILAYGLGMAVTLTGAGLLLARARDRVGRGGLGSSMPRAATLLRLLTVGSALVILCAGLVLVSQGLRAAV